MTLIFILSYNWKPNSFWSTSSLVGFFFFMIKVDSTRSLPRYIGRPHSPGDSWNEQEKDLDISWCSGEIYYHWISSIWGSFYWLLSQTKDRPNYCSLQNATVTRQKGCFSSQLSLQDQRDGGGLYQSPGNYWRLKIAHPSHTTCLCLQAPPPVLLLGPVFLL